MEKNIHNCNSRQSVALFVFYVLKIVVCKDDDFFVLTDKRFINEKLNNVP